MNILQKIDGHKTETAGGLSAIPGIMVALDLIWNFPPVYDQVVATVSLGIGALGGFGILHKFAKRMARRSTK